jgi:hypothetical protein
VTAYPVYPGVKNPLKDRMYRLHPDYAAKREKLAAQHQQAVQKIAPPRSLEWNDEKERMEWEPPFPELARNLEDLANGPCKEYQGTLLRAVGELLTLRYENRRLRETQKAATGFGPPKRRIDPTFPTEGLQYGG